ncbi:MAG: DNA recombination protein RmuC [Actinobacteria bacterium]|nr:DNA recombination protein RmuC [Actinomycetota bacterium]NBY15210.1 DNA recombination protein RmuC [Actinomycetota bacterium]
MTNSSAFIYVFIALFVGVGLGFIIGRGRKVTEGTVSGDVTLLQAQLISTQAQVEQLNSQLSAERSNANETIKLQTELAALKDGIAAITRSAADADRRRAAAEEGLRTQIRAMNESSTELVAQTTSIARVLNSSQARGKFGEAQLEKLLESAGLIEGEHYQVQRATTGEGNGRPDVTIEMPGASVLYIDSKFPFESFYQAYAVEDETQREALLKDHAKKLKDHIKTLSDREYQQQGTSPDFVILFAPIESILADALRIDSTLLDYAFKMKVTIATPTNMMALLRTVGYLFGREKVAKNATEIHDLAEKFLQDITKLYVKINEVGKNIERINKSYEDLTKVAQHTALRSAKKIRALDVQGPTPENPIEITQVVREITITEAEIEEFEIVDEE